MRPVWSLVGLSYMPPIIPQTQHFAQKITPEFCPKKLPHVPPLGGLGNGFGPIDAAKMCRYHSGQANATAARRPTARITAAPAGHQGRGKKFPLRGTAQPRKIFAKRA